MEKNLVRSRSSSRLEKMGKEQRRYPKRYSTQVPVEFLDKTKAKGTLINLSRDGILVTSKKVKSVNSFVRLIVFLPGIEKGVTINGKIVRHTTVNDMTAMGIQFLEMDAANRDQWLNYLSTFSRNIKASSAVDMVINQEKNINISVDNEEDEKNVNIDPFQTKESQFILKFKSVKRLEEFFPQNWKDEDFFIRTNIKKDKGDRIVTRMVHPESQEELKLNAIVQKYGKHPLKVHKEGIFFKIVGYNSKIEAKIRKFLKIEVSEE